MVLTIEPRMVSHTLSKYSSLCWTHDVYLVSVLTSTLNPHTTQTWVFIIGGCWINTVHLRVNPERGNCGKEVQLEMMIKREGITWHFLSPSAQGITQCVHTIASLVQGFLPETPTTIDHHFGCRQPHRNRLNEEKLHAHAVFISPAISSNLDSNLQHRHCDHVCSLERMYHNFFHSQSVSQTGRQASTALHSKNIVCNRLYEEELSSTALQAECGLINPAISENLDSNCNMIAVAIICIASKECITMLSKVTVLPKEGSLMHVWARREWKACLFTLVHLREARHGCVNAHPTASIFKRWMQLPLSTKCSSASPSISTFLSEDPRMQLYSSHRLLYTQPSSNIT